MASVSKRRWTKPDGATAEAWVVRYSDGKGGRPSKQFDSKKAADAYKRRVEREIEDGVHVRPSDRATVKEVADEYLRQAEQRQRDGRIGRSRLGCIGFTLDKSILPFMGSRVMAEIKVSDLEAFYKDMINKSGLAISTAKDRINTYGLMERFAKKRGYIKERIVPDAMNELRGVAKTRVRTFTREEALQLLRTADVRAPGQRVRSYHMLRTAVNIAAFCGLRAGEIMALTPACIDFERGEIKVTRNMTVFGEIKGPKTAAGLRSVPCPDHVLTLLKVWMTQHRIKQDDGPIFQSWNGNFLNRGSFGRTWLGLLTRAGLEDGGERFHFHALRHFCASWLIENHWPLTDVAALLGHSKFDTTLQTYAHVVVRSAARRELMQRTAANLLAA